MTKLTIWRAKPNPAGKDKAIQTPKPEQLNGEWVEIKNSSAQDAVLTGTKLAHTVFNADGTAKPDPEVYWTCQSHITLKHGQVVRVHTGKSADAGSMHIEDRQGADYHEYAEHGRFKLNNREGDTIYLFTPTLTDSASFDGDVREGAVLVRQGDELVDPNATATIGAGAKTWSAPPVIGNSGKAA